MKMEQQSSNSVDENVEQKQYDPFRVGIDSKNIHHLQEQRQQQNRQKTKLTANEQKRLEATDIELEARKLSQNRRQALQKYRQQEVQEIRRQLSECDDVDLEIERLKARRCALQQMEQQRQPQAVSMGAELVEEERTVVEAHQNQKLVEHVGTGLKLGGQVRNRK